MTHDLDEDRKPKLLQETYSTNHGDLLEEWSSSGPRLLWVDGDSRTEMLHLDRDARLLRIYPKVPLTGSTNDFDVQFRQVQEIQLDLHAFPDLEHLQITEQMPYGPALDSLPDGFGRFLDFGLGFPRQYRAFIRLIEKYTRCTTVRFVGADDVQGADDLVFNVALAQFAEFMKTVNTTKNRIITIKRRAADTAAHNVIADLVGKPKIQMPLGRLPAIRDLSRAITNDHAFDPDERAELMNSMRTESRAAAEDDPVGFGKLRSDIELVSLDTLIRKFEQTLATQPNNEPAWQSFFENNTFALQQLFAAPLVLFGTQEELRIQTRNNASRRVGDFILANVITRTVTVVEIKTAATKLTGAKFRGTESGETYPPSVALTGGVAQLQAQMESARTDYQAILANSAGEDNVDTTIVRGAMIAGSLQNLDRARQQSFERYRNGLSDVVVVTFDEVLERLKHLHTLLIADND